MREQGEQPRTRARRCATHPDMAEVGRCRVCGRALCLSCAVPFRGGIVGPECLSSVLDDAPPPPPIRAARYSRGDLLAATGFGLVTVLSVFPWSEGPGNDTGYFGAWSLHWSLLGVLAGLLGLALAVTLLSRPRSPRITAAAYGALAASAALGALLHSARPPLLSEASVVAELAAAAAGIAFLGALVKASAAVRAGRSPRWRP